MNRGDKFLEGTLQGRSSERSRQGYTSVVRSEIDASHPSPPPTAYVRRDGASAATPLARYVVRQNVEGCMCAKGEAGQIELTLLGLFFKPWSCKWALVLGIGLLLSASLYGIALAAPSIQSRLLYTIAMSVCIPAATCCLLMEWDVTCNVRWHSVLLVAVVGGCLSASVAEVLNNYFSITCDNAKMAALTEEPTKGCILIALLFFVRRFPGILSGLALGCAIGAGFAVFETVEYAYAYGDGPIPSIKVLALRGVLSPMMHMAWTGVLGAALWAARGVSPNWRKIMLSWPVWVTFMGMIMFHALWNSVGVVYVLAFLLWGLILHYVRRGVNQAIEFNLIRKEGIR